MARSRNIKPGFFTNERLAQLPPHARLLFAGLWTVADKEGRFEVRPAKIWAEVFPYEPFMLEPSTSQACSKHEPSMNHACSMIELWLAQLWQAGFITFYEANGRRFGQVNNWRRHQSPHHKEAASKIPQMPHEKTFNNHEDIHAWIKHESCINQARFKHESSMVAKKRVNPPDSLIPDSLIPDSLIPVHDDEAVMHTVIDDEFEKFWEHYPRKVSKKSAFKSWRALKPGRAQQERILQDIALRLRLGLWSPDDKTHIPHAATYLNQRRFDDDHEELRSEATQRSFGNRGNPGPVPAVDQVRAARAREQAAQQGPPLGHVGGHD